MHPRAQEFVDRASSRYSFTPDVHEFSEGTKTAADAATAVGCETAQIASSLAFEAGDDLVVVVTSGANRVSETALADHLGIAAESVSMADPDRIADTLGWSIGGVPPICHETEVPIVLDRTLLDHDTVWAAAGTPQAVFPIEPTELRELTAAEPAPIAA